MRELMLYVWIVTIIGNVVLSLFLVFGQYYIRFGWLTVATVAAVLIDFLMWWCHTFTHSLYEPLRMFIFYALFWLLNVLVIWESWKLGERRVRIPVEIQLGLALACLMAHRLDFPHLTYDLECFSRLFNLLVIMWFISIFSKENTYAPYP